MQQLDGEQRVAAGVVVQLLPEVCPQAVGLAVDVGIDEGPPIGPVQVDQDVAPLADQLRAGRRPTPRLQRPRVSARRPALRTVGADEQDPAAGQAAPQVKEQRGRAAVGPLQVIDRQEQGPCDGQDMQHLGHLGE